MVLLHAAVGNDEMGPAMGFQLWAEGNAVIECNLWRDPDGTWRSSGPLQAR
jgi:hypothetical protein